MQLLQCSSSPICWSHVHTGAVTPVEGSQGSKRLDQARSGVEGSGASGVGQIEAKIAGAAEHKSSDCRGVKTWIEGGSAWSAGVLTHWCMGAVARTRGRGVHEGWLVTMECSWCAACVIWMAHVLWRSVLGECGV